MLASIPTCLAVITRHKHEIIQDEGVGLGEPEASMVGAKGVVTVDMRFDAGYFVTVRINRQEFKGLLYYPPPDHTQVLPPHTYQLGVKHAALLEFVVICTSMLQGHFPVPSPQVLFCRSCTLHVQIIKGILPLHGQGPSMVNMQGSAAWLSAGNMPSRSLPHAFDCLLSTQA